MAFAADAGIWDIFANGDDGDDHDNMDDDDGMGDDLSLLLLLGDFVV